MKRPTLIVASDVVEAAVEVWLSAYRTALWEGRSFGVALAGGATPRALYSRLAVEPLDWSRIEVFLGDERAVPFDDPASNWGMVSRVLLEPASVPPENAHRPAGDADDLEAAASQYAGVMEQLLPLSSDGVPVFDLILLGLGTDGHTASLFPGSRALSVQDRWFVSTPGPSQAEPRLTITYPVIRAARSVCVLVVGGAKAEALASTLGEDGEVPAARLRDWEHVLWLSDDEAAARVLQSGGLCEVVRR